MTQRLCVIGCQITLARIHTPLKHLASANAHHDNSKQNHVLTSMQLQTNSCEDEEEDDVFYRCPIILRR